MQSIFESLALLFILASLALGYYCALLPREFTTDVRGRDTRIRVWIGDAFDAPGAVVIPFNNRFDADLSGVAARSKSLHGDLLQRYFSSDSGTLQNVIDGALQKQSLATGRAHPIGTVVQLQSGSRRFYLLAVTEINISGRAKTTVENVRRSLPLLWVDISDRGDKGEVIIPLLGTGHGRLAEPRSMVAELIIDSYLAAIGERNFCDRLTLAILPSDLHKGRTLRLQDLHDYLSAKCKYATFEAPPAMLPHGTPSES